MSTAPPIDPSDRFDTKHRGPDVAADHNDGREAHPEQSASQKSSDDKNAQSEDSQLSQDARETGNGGSRGDADEPLALTIEALTDCVKAMQRQLLESFERKLAYDSFKERQIERLHNELQEYRRGFAESLLLPLIQQLVRYIDQIPRHIEALRKKPSEELGPERLVQELQGVRDDLEIILENAGVAIVQSTEPRFDPRSQQARSTEATDDSRNHGVVAARLLPGYSLNGKQIEKERVKVFVYRDAPAVATGEAKESPK